MSIIDPDDVITVSTYLCIGGPADGTRVQAKGTAMFVPERDPEKLISYTHVSSEVCKACVKVHTYLLSSVRGERSVFLVWLHESMTPDKAIKRLLDAYADTIQSAKDG